MPWKRFSFNIAGVATNYSPPAPARPVHVGSLLRDWRLVRRLSQLDLALDADVSARHLSCIETGKALPSRDMVLRLAQALEVPLRERNALLTAAGYAPTYTETALTAPEMTPIRKAIELILERHAPYPAFVMNRYWDVLLANRPLSLLVDLLRAGVRLSPNLMRQVFDPRQMRPLVANWSDVASDLIHHLHDEVAAAPSDTRSRDLLAEVLAYPGIPDRWHTREPGAAPLPLLTTVFRKDDLELRFFSTFTTFGTSRDITTDELRIESMFPVDAHTAEFCRTLNSEGPTAGASIRVD